MASINIFQKKSVGVDGEASINLQITHKKKRLITRSLNIKVAPKSWDSAKKKIKNHPLAKDLNDDIRDYEERIESILHEMRHNINEEELGKKVDEILGKAKIASPDEPKELSLLEYLQEFIKASPKTRVKATILKYKSLKNILTEFQMYHSLKKDMVKFEKFAELNKKLNRFEKIKALGQRIANMKEYNEVLADVDGYNKYRSYTLNFEGMDLAFEDKFKDFLYDVKNHVNNSAAKTVSNLFTFLKWADEQGCNVNPEYKKFTWNEHDVTPLFFYEEELMALYALELPLKSQERVKDLFCLACWVGLRYSDILKLSLSDIKDDAIHIKAKKVAEDVVIPLNPYSRAILKKYDYKLPTVANSKANKVIKEVCKIAGFTRPEKIVEFRRKERVEFIKEKWETASFHDARRTFIVLLLVKRVPIELVMGMSGHMDYRSFKKYVKIAPIHSKDAMKSAWG